MASRDRYHIQRAALEDAEAILDIQKRAFAEEGRLSNNWDIPPLTEDIATIQLHIRNQTALIATGDGRILGAARGITEGILCTIRGVCVEPAYHGKGIGSSLVRAIEQAHPKVARFELTTNTLVPGNVSFYERHGYRVVSFTKYGNSITLAQMSKTQSGKDA